MRNASQTRKEHPRTLKGVGDTVKQLYARWRSRSIECGSHSRRWLPVFGSIDRSIAVLRSRLSQRGEGKDPMGLLQTKREGLKIEWPHGSRANDYSWNTPAEH
jgi:hypothetical protein